MCVCVCVCVQRVREREAKKFIKKIGDLGYIYIFREREREREILKKVIVNYGFWNLFYFNFLIF